MSAVPAGVGPAIPYADKLGHLLLFGLLGTALVRIEALERRGRAGSLAVVAAVCLFGLLDEGRQALAPQRSAELLDWVADVVGAALAVAAYRRIPRYRRLLEWRIQVFPGRTAGGTGSLPGHARRE